MAENFVSGAFWFDQALDGTGSLADVAMEFILDDELIKLKPAPPNFGGAAAGEPQQKPKGKGGRRPLTAEEKAARVEKEREQNRVMQARYRQRQKERKQQMEQEHEAVSEDLLRVRQEHESLQHANSLLESLLRVRNDTLAVLERASRDGEDAKQQQQPEQAQQVRQAQQQQAQQQLQTQVDTAGAAPNGSGDVSGTAAPSTSLLQGANQQQQQHQAGAGAGCGLAGQQHTFEELSHDNSTCPRGLCDGGDSSYKPGDSPLAPSDSCPTSSGGGGGIYGGGASNEIVWQEPGELPGRFEDGNFDPHFDPLAHISVDPAFLEEIKNATPEQYIKDWGVLAEGMRDMLIEYDTTHREHLLTQIKALLEGRALRMSLTLRHNPACVQQLFASSANHGMGEAEERDKRDTVVAAMQITRQQRERWICAFEAYQHKVQRLRVHKSQALALIRQASMEGMSVAGASLSGMMSQYLQVMDAAAKLHSYPESEFTALLEVMSETGRLLTPLQKARLLVSSAPHFPDILRIMEAVTRTFA